METEQKLLSTNVFLNIHPDVLFAYKQNSLELVLIVENRSDQTLWGEADIIVPPQLSLFPESSLQRGRVRMGILNGHERIEKSVRLYGTTLTNPGKYKVSVTVYLFDKDGVISERIDDAIDITCEVQKPAVI